MLTFIQESRRFFLREKEKDKNFYLKGLKNPTKNARKSQLKIFSNFVRIAFLNR